MFTLLSYVTSDEQAYCLCCEMTPESRNIGAKERAVARQQIGKHVPAATNTQEATEELFDACFLCGLCRINGKHTISSSQNFMLLYAKRTSVHL
jgi:hypothetical protein